MKEGVSLVIEIPDDIPCLSVTEPWAWCLVNGLKDIENRSRRTNYRGPILIHASKGERPGDWLKAAEIEWNAHRSYIPVDTPRGGIIGLVNIVDCVEESSSPWFFGPFGWVVRDAVPIPFIPCKGQLGFWKPPADVLATVRLHLQNAG